MLNISVLFNVNTTHSIFNYSLLGVIKSGTSTQTIDKSKRANSACSQH